MNRVWLALALAPVLLGGCSASKPPPASSVGLEPTVKVVRPQPRTIVRRVAQPGVIESYEQTALYPKISGYVRKWLVDVGDHVYKDEVLAELDVPELVEEQKQKDALVEQARAMVEQARKQQAVAERMLEASADEIAEAKANVKRYAAESAELQSLVERVTVLVGQNAVSPVVLDEKKKQYQSSQAAQEGAAAAVKTREAQRLTTEAEVQKARADVAAAEAKVKVAEADALRVAALVGYTRLTAPYEGVITDRNVSTGDFVRPASGDPSEGRFASAQSSTRATPLFLLARTDRLLFVIGVPELDAGFVAPGTPALVRVQALGNKEMPLTMSRISRRLESTSRTLQAQIDLPNPDGKLMPGMYATGSVTIERKGVKAVPTTAVMEKGDQACCYQVVDGKAVRTPVQTGVSDGTWVEVRRKEVKGTEGAWEWADFTGEEAVFVGDLSELTDGAAVRVDAEK